MTRLVLASSSPYRRELLARLGLPFVTHAPQIDETPRAAETPEALVRRLSQAKARAVAGAFPQSLVIGSDQIAVAEGRIVGKPGDRETAAAQLAAASGRRVRFLTGCAVLSNATGTCEVAVVPCEITFRRLRPADIEAYLAAEKPYDCAGAIKCEGLGIALLERIDGPDPSALTGLPLIALCGMLRRAGLDPLTASHAELPVPEQGL